MLVHESTHAHALVVELRARRIHVAVGIDDRLRLVVMRQATIVAKAHRHRFMAAVHRHEVDIDVDDEVALARAAVDAEVLPVARLAETHETIGLFGVVAVIAIGIEGVVDLVTHHPAHFRFRQLPVERVRNDDVGVVDAVVGQKLEHHLERGLTGIGSHHRWQRQADVIDGDGHLHARLQLRVERIAAERVIDGVADRTARVRKSLYRRLRVDHPGADREVLFPKVFAKMNDSRRGIGVDVNRTGVELSTENRHY